MDEQQVGDNRTPFGWASTELDAGPLVAEPDAADVAVVESVLEATEAELRGEWVAPEWLSIRFDG